jgi:hypothetical protein
VRAVGERVESIGEEVVRVMDEVPLLLFRSLLPGSA